MSDSILRRLKRNPDVSDQATQERIRAEWARRGLCSKCGRYRNWLEGRCLRCKVTPSLGQSREEFLKVNPEAIDGSSEVMLYTPGGKRATHIGQRHTLHSGIYFSSTCGLVSLGVGNIDKFTDSKDARFYTGPPDECDCKRCHRMFTKLLIVHPRLFGRFLTWNAIQVASFNNKIGDTRD